MLPIDYAQNALLRRDHVLRFVPADQCDIFRDALTRLEQDGHKVYKLSLVNVETEIELLNRISVTILPPLVIENWGIFGDWMNRLSFLIPEGRGCFFCMEGALLFWRKHTLIAGSFSNEFQSQAFQWARHGTFLMGIYELR
jgi:hypothetical protein